MAPWRSKIDHLSTGALAADAEVVVPDNCKPYLRTNSTAVTATGSWPLYRFGYQFTGGQALDEDLRAIRRRLGRCQGRKVERRRRRHA